MKRTPPLAASVALEMWPCHQTSGAQWDVKGVSNIYVIPCFTSEFYLFRVFWPQMTIIIYIIVLSLEPFILAILRNHQYLGILDSGCPVIKSNQQNGPARIGRPRFNNICATRRIKLLLYFLLGLPNIFSSEVEPRSFCKSKTQTGKQINPWPCKISLAVETEPLVHETVIHRPKTSRNISWGCSFHMISSQQPKLE
jgi:hypothetical protein